eukprot:GHVR01068534.1.p1 GENE.GHVR01068534.1~~GHVR01068534.1.p1  ORF type:complete len:343 (+),score=54.74 GHVR01068534.1:223-1251(+)
MISNYMKPDSIQINEISEVLYDGHCNNIINNDRGLDMIPYTDAKCLIIKYYIYDKINNLAQYIVEYNRPHDYKNGNLDLVFDRVFVQILTGLNYLHDPLSREHTHSKSVIHMDLKPANIFISNNPETDEIECRLGDFEYSVFGTECDKPRGTPRYYDPRRADVFLSNRNVQNGISQFNQKHWFFFGKYIYNKSFTNKTEIYSVGLMMFQFCFLSDPFFFDSTLIGKDELEGYLAHIVWHNYFCSSKDDEEIKRQCEVFIEQQKVRLFGRTPSQGHIFHLLYAEATTHFSANNLFYENINKRVIGNCSENRFNLIKKMLQYEDKNRPTAGEALKELKGLQKNK